MIIVSKTRLAHIPLSTALCTVPWYTPLTKTSISHHKSVYVYIQTDLTTGTAVISPNLTTGNLHPQHGIKSHDHLVPAAHRATGSNGLVGYTIQKGAGIACWLERRTLDRKVASSDPGRSGGRIFFSRVCVLILSPFHPRVTAVARKRPPSFCQNCRWQVTPKHAYTLDPTKSEWADYDVQA